MYNESSREVLGFIQSIIADPLNDDPRKVFADWLEENGGEDRAEFIRAQLILDRQREMVYPSGYYCPHRNAGQHVCKECLDLTDTERKVLLLTMPRLYDKTAVDLTAPRGWLCGCSITDREWSWHTLGKPHIINPEPNTIIKLILKHEFEGIWFSFVEGIKSDDEVYTPRG